MGVHNKDTVNVGIVADIRKQIHCHEREALWIVWKYAPELLPEGVRTWQELHDTYKSFQSPKDYQESDTRKYPYQEKMQRGIKYLLKRMDAKRDIDLLNKFYELAMTGDIQALKAYTEFKKKFFESGQESELKAILSGANVEDDEEDEEYEMDI